MGLDLSSLYLRLFGDKVSELTPCLIILIRRALQTTDAKNGF
jgi:hypothetical protein